MKEDNEKEYLYIVKALAILSVICAHCGNVPETYSSLNRAASAWLGYYGTAGVPVFYLLSGYFFENNKRPWGNFWKTKTKTIIVPWFFCATLLWLYVVLRKGGISFGAWLSSVLGNGSSFYYITVLLMLYILLYKIKEDYRCCFLCIIITAISIVATSKGVNFTNRWFENMYLNPLNWAGYFAGGILVKRYRCMEKIRKVSALLLPASIILYLISVSVHYSYDITWSYWSKWSIVNIAIQIILCLGIASYILQIKVLAIHAIRIGEFSYPIYLLHQLFAGGLVVLTNYRDWFWLTLFRPYMLLFFMYVMLYALQYIVSKYFPGEKRFLMLIGMRIE